jgi:NADH-quinone oxidoreductase subunit E
MTVKTMDSKDISKTVDSIIDEYEAKKEELIPVLMKANQKLGFLSSEALAQISERMHIPQSQVYSVASFYRMIYTKPTGRHVIKFCESAPCHVAGGREVWNEIQKELNIKPGETSSDGKWTLTVTSCLGVCAVGPAMLIDDDIYGNISPDQLSKILGKYE